ncbi:MAG: phosphoribosylformylglycinamidine synthase, partial [Syntrophothermus sp.]
MVIFFKSGNVFYAVETEIELNQQDHRKLTWLFGKAEYLPQEKIEGTFLGPRREMITPWSTNAVEITQNMGIRGIRRIEEFTLFDKQKGYDPMLQAVFAGLDQHIFHIAHLPDPVYYIEDISAYNQAQGLALSREEIGYLEQLAKKTGRLLTDSEVFGFSQVNSEHCRHKIFNGIFIIDGKEMPFTLFDLIRSTSKAHPGLLVSAYKDNVAFIKGPRTEQFAPLHQEKPDDFVIIDFESVISLKAETHNFPTTVEPFNGAATGSGGEIRDRMAGGKGSIPLAGTAVYMTSYSRNDKGRQWEENIPERNWLYKHPEEILIKASNGASDFGNKFGQALICGSVLTFEHQADGRKYGYDKVIMLAGGIGFAKEEDSLKDSPKGGEKVVILGGDNYRIGMGGGAVSSVATGEYENAIELNAVQRSNPEMQKRVFNAIRALCESAKNPVISIHDHGAGGHLNSISELIEETGGVIHIDKLPVGDPTLSDREIISNESQERMGLVMREEDAELLNKIAERERAPMYLAGETTGDHKLEFKNGLRNSNPVDLTIEDFFGKPPKTILYDTVIPDLQDDLQYDPLKVQEYLSSVLKLEAVACKDWLTNKVDRAVSGKIALQQTCGPVQLPLNNLGVTALDYRGEKGIATSLGHAPAAGLIDPAAASRLAIAESLTNILWAPLTHGMQGISLSANWMWPCKNKGEDNRLYRAVEACSQYAIDLGINIPTGKDSLSMTQKYPDGSVVYSPGTVIISAVAEVSDVKKCISPELSEEPGTVLLYVNFGGDGFELGGSSFSQILNKIGNKVPATTSAADIAEKFAAIQQMINEGEILSGHDISAGGMITTLLEMTFPVLRCGIDADLTTLGEADSVRVLFSEKPGIILQVKNKNWKTGETIRINGIEAIVVGTVSSERVLNISNHGNTFSFDINKTRD